MNLDWIHLPIQDDAAPDNSFIQALLLQKMALMTKLSNSESIAIHCKGGSGRTGLMAAILLRIAGYSLEQAIEKVQQIRPRALTIPAHLAFLSTFKLD